MHRSDGDPFKLLPELIEHFAEHFDHHDPRFGQDPHPVYRRMRERSPIAWSDCYGGFWVVTGYEEARDVWKDYELFATQPSVSVPAGLGHHRPMLPLEVDPPLHGRYRSLLAPVFAPKRIEAMEPEIRETCDRLIDAFIERGSCELISELAQPLPTEIFVKMLGIPLEEASRFQAWNHEILHGQHADPSGASRERAGKEAHQRLTEILHERRHRRRDDIMSVLLGSEVEGERLSEDEILDIVFLLFLAGLDTVQGALGFQFAYLAQNPAQRDRLVRDASLVPNAVEELLRWESLNTSGRNVTRDAVFKGVEMKQGQPLVIVNRSANRDAKVFDQPDAVDFDRRTIRSLAFAVGPHRCVGSHLARLELQIAHERMHARIPDYRLEPGVFVSIHGGNVAGVDALPLVWDPSGR